MPLYDRLCESCGNKKFDNWEPSEAPNVPCPICSKPTVRAWLGKSASIVPDGIPGGVWIKHGLCDEVTGEPKRYDSKSDIAREAKRRGWENRVEHVSAPGTDKNPHTTRWI